MKIKEPVQSTFCDNGTIIDRIGSLTFITKVKRMKGKAASLVENLMDEFHRPHRMKTRDQWPYKLFASRRKLGCSSLGLGPHPSPSSSFKLSFLIHRLAKVLSLRTHWLSLHFSKEVKLLRKLTLFLSSKRANNILQGASYE